MAKKMIKKLVKKTYESGRPVVKEYIEVEAKKSSPKKSTVKKVVTGELKNNSK